MNHKQKLIHYLKEKGYSKNSFYERTGLSQGFLDRGKSLGVDNACTILKAYPDLNIFWFIMDQGNMIVSSDALNNISSNDIQNDVFVKSILILVENTLKGKLDELENVLYLILADLKAKDAISETTEELNKTNKRDLSK